ncbi:DUF2062 domain-containing protein [Oceanomicrobium pacificus]|uniref:DUF2062 domain-containing protein n=1 Tax=Oceanomicrobium pacificus TaxID=2692916 RepID=A0A6B0TRY2_9RHOB|nr:DUF2062 domain-containing protein [Oceanomicrobium pacificus]MXU63962.1 DUF2062 domain-containing protein [Oceanomicrobium pacificus]
MVFKRRDQPSLWQRLQEAFYPRKGWRRGIEYVGHRVRRLPDSPHKIALGLSCGVMACFTPFFGLQFFYAALLARLLRANFLASLLGTFFGNPITFPIIAIVSLNLGRVMMGQGRHGRDVVGLRQSFGDALSGIWTAIRSPFTGEPVPWAALSQFWEYIFLPYWLGGLLPGMLTAGLIYMLSRPLIAAYQARRRGRLLEKAKRKLSAAQRKADGLREFP